MLDTPELQREDLEALVIANDQFERLEAAFDRFCPFEAMGVVRSEIRHGAYLSKMLRPAEPHGHCSKLLRALMTVAVSKVTSQDFSPMDVHLLDLEDAEVVPQWIAPFEASIRTGQKSGQQRLDILVVCPSARTVVSIELKIDAEQSTEQLSTYRKMVSRAYPDFRRLFIFLTKRGDEPDDPDGTWVSVTLEDMVAAFERLVDSPGAEPAARDMLKSYFAMLRRHHMSDPDLERYASALWRKHRAALEFLMDRQPDALGQVFRSLCADAVGICQEIEPKGIGIEPDTTDGVLRFGIKDWDGFPNIHSADSWTKSNRIILLEVTRYKDTIRAFHVIGRGDQKTREWIFEALKADTTLKTNAKLAQQWHRVGRQNLHKTTDADDIDVPEVTRQCREKLIAYIERTVPRMTELLKNNAPQGNEIKSNVVAEASA